LLAQKYSKLNHSINIKQKLALYGTADALPASKSISNRVLVMNAMSTDPSVVHNLSDANDTQLMLGLVKSSHSVIDVEDAGTTMRFLTAYFSITNQQKTVTGTHRMKERPIGILVNALRSLGVDIVYQEIEGYPPLKINGFKKQLTNAIKIRGDVSSQFISALMMVAPILPQGLTLELEGKIGSLPYIKMTASLMEHFHVKAEFKGNKIAIAPQQYKPTEFTVESDWSAASYWFAFAALAEDAEIFLPRLSLNSLQGDRAIVEIMENLGVTAQLAAGKLKLTKTNYWREIRCDFTHCPDLAQTVAVVCAAKNIIGFFTGMESLRIKETDRITALQLELRKIGADLLEENAQWKLIPSSNLPPTAEFNTYKDHRMAMAFAPLATRMNVVIENPGVVKKSYPKFWDDMKRFDFELFLR
jgi:3-phosphoshikimate 1-carboxyvinyltransferase